MNPNSPQEELKHTPAARKRENREEKANRRWTPQELWDAYQRNLDANGRCLQEQVREQAEEYFLQKVVQRWIHHYVHTGNITPPPEIMDEMRHYQVSPSEPTLSGTRAENPDDTCPLSTEEIPENMAEIQEELQRMLMEQIEEEERTGGTESRIESDHQTGHE